MPSGWGLGWINWKLGTKHTGLYATGHNDLPYAEHAVSIDASLVEDQKGGQGLPVVVVLIDTMAAGGTERQVVEMLRGLRRSGLFRLKLAVLDRGGALEEEAAEVAEEMLPLRRKWRFDATPCLSLAWQARMGRLDLIHAFGWKASVVGLLAARCGGVPIINGSVRSAPIRLLPHHRISRLCAARSDAIVANSRAGLEAWGLSRNPRARVIYNGFDFRRFDCWRGRCADDPTVCMVANFRPEKDHATVLLAMKEVREVEPTVKLVLVGYDEGTLPSMRTLVARIGLTGSVEFVNGTTDPLPFICASRVCVLASTNGEGISNAILEYMALGKPVVATDIGGNREVVVDGVTGFLVPQGQPKAIADRILHLLREPGRAHSMGNTGRARVLTHFGLDRMTAEYERLYIDVLGLRR